MEDTSDKRVDEAMSATPSSPVDGPLALRRYSTSHQLPSRENSESLDQLGRALRLHIDESARSQSARIDEIARSQSARIDESAESQSTRMMQYIDRSISALECRLRVMAGTSPSKFRPNEFPPNEFRHDTIAGMPAPPTTSGSDGWVTTHPY